MLDRWTARLVKAPLHLLACRLHGLGIRPDQITVCGFFVGTLSVPQLFLLWQPQP